MNQRTKKKRQQQRAQYAAYPNGTPGGGMMYVPAGQQQGTLGQTFYGSSAANVNTGTQALFSPGQPLPNLPNVNPAGQPVQFKFPVSYNAFPVDRTLNNPEIPSFEQLRALARLYNGITLCERAWFDMVPKMKLNINLKPEYVVAGADPKDYQTEITYFMNWFESPDKMHDLHSWLRIALKEQTQIDELYIYKRRKRNGFLHALEINAGDQFKPLLDDWGKIPQYPNYGYQQYPWSIPGAWFTTRDLIHYQESPAADSPYGQSRVERIIMLVNQALRKQKKDLSHFTEGNIPQGMMLVPESAIWTPDQIDAFEQAWNSLLAGNASQQVRMRFTQPGMKYQPFEQYLLDPTFDKFLINISVSAYGLSMQDVAFTEDIHKSSGDFQENVTYRRTVDPLATIYANILTEVINVDFPPELKGEMFQVSFGGYEEEEDVSEMSGAYSELVKSGILGVTAAGKLLKLPDDPNAPYIGRVIITKDGPVFLDDMATDKMRQAQVQAQLAGLQAATTNPTGQKPAQPEQTAQTESTATSGASSGIQQSKVKKPDAMKTANAAPQLNPKYQAPKGQTNASAATDDLGGMQPQLRAVKQEEEPLDKNDTTDDKFHDFVDHQDADDDLSDFEPSLMGDSPIDFGPDDFSEEDEEEIDDLGGQAFNPAFDEDKADWSPEDHDTENEIELLLNSDKDEPFSDLERTVISEFDQLYRHHPGGKDHDQKTHGNWSHEGSPTPSKTGVGAKQAQNKSSAPATPAAKAPPGLYAGVNAKIIKASAAVQTAAKDLLTARKNLESASALDKANARKAVALARQELHDARLALELYRQQARHIRIQQQQQARKDAAAQRQKMHLAAAKEKAQRQQAKAKLAAQKTKAAHAKTAASAKAKAARLAAKAQLKAQIAAAKAAKKSTTTSHTTSFKAAAKNNSAAKTVQSLVNSIASKQVLYNTLATRPISKNWTQQDAAQAHQISLDLKQLTDAVNNHSNEADMNGLLNNLQTTMSQLSGQGHVSHKISSGTGKVGASVTGLKTTPALSSGRVNVMEKLIAKAQTEAKLNRAVEGDDFYASEQEEDESYRYSIRDVIELFSEQMQDEETDQNDGKDFERSSEAQMVERTAQSAFEGIGGEESSKDYRRWRDRALDDVKSGRTFRGFTTVAIPPRIQAYISDELVECTTQEEVKAVFQRVREMQQHQLTIFLDVDGVLSIANAGNQVQHIENKEAWPIPQFQYLLQMLAKKPQFSPVWMTHWGQKANGFAERAGIDSWQVAFPLSASEEMHASALFPGLARKQLAIAYYLQKHALNHAIWIQDGFAPETHRWAQQAHITLIDTNSEPFHSLLLNHTERAIQEFIALLLESDYERV